MNHYHQGEPVPRKSWMMEHSDKPVVNDGRNHQQHQSYQQLPPSNHQHEPIQMQPQMLQPHPQMQQQSPPTPEQHYQHVEQPPVVLSRQEERAQARNQARTNNPRKNSTNINDIWEVVKALKLFNFIFLFLYNYVICM